MTWGLDRPGTLVATAGNGVVSGYTGAGGPTRGPAPRVGDGERAPEPPVSCLFLLLLPLQGLQGPLERAALAPRSVAGRVQRAGSQRGAGGQARTDCAEHRATRGREDKAAQFPVLPRSAFLGRL